MAQSNSKRQKKEAPLEESAADHASQIFRSGDLSSRESALRSINQLRALPTAADAALGRSIRSSVKTGIQKSRKAMSSECYSCCHSCGLGAPNEASSQAAQDSAQFSQCMKALENRVIGLKKFSLSGSALPLCASRLKLLRKGKRSRYALAEGWALDEEAPKELLELSKYEALLISLRLPFASVWRDKGHKQCLSNGSALSYGNSSGKLRNLLPRSPTKVSKFSL